MALSNPLDGERRPGLSSGTPLPGVEVRLVDEARHRGAPTARRASSRCAGRRCSASTGSGRTRRATAFRDGWFRTGDVAVRRARVRTGCSAAPAWTSSRPAASRCRRSRSKRCCARIPAIAECAVVGVQRRRTGASACRRPWSCGTARALSLDDLQQWAKAAARALQGSARAAAGRGAAAQRDGQGRQAGGCRAVQIGITSGHGPAPRRRSPPLSSWRWSSPPAWRTPSATSAKAASPRAGAAADARCVVRRLPSGVSQRAHASSPASAGRPTTRTPRST